MTEHSKADEARKGLIDSVKGKAKEVFGAVTGNDSLTAEGQLEQTEARERKEANSVEAVADAEAAQARAEAAEAQVKGARERIAVDAQTAAVESSVRDQQAAQKRAAEAAGQQDAAIAKTRAELDAQAEIQQAKERDEIDSATEQVVDAAADHQAAMRGASSAEAEADRIRRQADELTKEADLP
ncbi:CsbD family protein [Mycobacterium sp. URHB0044]|uniref:CsbD family protein n=1 Tax=Mycobacterium sp. URHB0044 TaxID=1380386 RepID=UPI00048A63C5|nr:CsbD family protein [Mycobacterium sp. URHB0044]